MNLRGRTSPGVPISESHSLCVARSRAACTSRPITACASRALVACISRAIAACASRADSARALRAIAWRGVALLGYLAAASALAQSPPAQSPPGQKPPSTQRAPVDPPSIIKQMQAPPKPGVPALEQLAKEAEALRPLAKSELAGKFLAAVAALPKVDFRKVYLNTERTVAVTHADYGKLPMEERKKLRSRPIDDHFYYYTRYGTPLAYVRPLDLLSKAGLGDLAGKRVLDFGYGGIGHLRLMASLGADVVGVDVDPILAAVYSEPTDQGEIAGHGGAAGGKLKLVNGRWPGDAATKTAVGGGFDLIVSKNTLKNGYIHPAEAVDERQLVRLGVDDAAYVKALWEALKPGGRVLIYNLCPAPAEAGKPYIPWADGRCPFPREMLEQAGFRVVKFDENDDAAARALGKALGWDGEGMDLEKDLFALWTLLEKK